MDESYYTEIEDLIENENDASNTNDQSEQEQETAEYDTNDIYATVERLATQNGEDEDEQPETPPHETEEILEIKKYVQQNEISSNEAAEIIEIADDVSMNDNQYLQICNFLKKAHKALPNEHVGHLVSFIKNISAHQMKSKELLMLTTDELKKEWKFRRELQSQVTYLQKQHRQLSDELKKEQRKRPAGTVNNKCQKLSHKFDQANEETKECKKIQKCDVHHQISVEF